MVASSLRVPRPRGLRHHLHVVRVIGAAEFKLKYSGSALGYLWSVLKPLGLFAMLYAVFGRLFKLQDFPHYPLYLLLGIVLWTYFVDTTTVAMPSLVARSSLISKLSFPRLIIPLSVSATTSMTLGVNLLVVAIFVGANRIGPRVTWLLLIPLFLELFLISFAVGLFLSALFVRLRDIGQVWELALQLMFYASPIIYPLGFLPSWLQPVSFLSPLVQIIEDARWALLPNHSVATAPAVFGTPYGELAPLGVAAVIIVGSFLFFQRESPGLAERT